MLTESMLNSKITLNNGIELPILGLGTWELKRNDCLQAVKWALEAGYRHIDTATLYGNEKQVGIAIKESGIPREEIFITTKVWDSDQGYEKTLTALDKSLNNLDTSYVNLYLIHWPRELRNETWRAMENLLDEGKVWAIGVSNFSIHHIDDIIDNSSTIPAVNQIQITPFNYKRDLIDYCKNNQIAVEAYSPLTHGKQLNNPKLISIAQKYEKSTAQVLIRWGLEHNFIEIPRSRSEKHIYENIDVFDFSLSDDDMTFLDNLHEPFHILFDTNDWK